jgi:hypothetical protein
MFVSNVGNPSHISVLLKNMKELPVQTNPVMQAKWKSL